MTTKTATTTKAPKFCPYSECLGRTFTLLGLIGKLAFWRCANCGKDFDTNA